MTVDTLMPIIVAFSAGLFGTTHCALMCGGIVSLLVSNTTKKSHLERVLILLTYNLGRITSYSLAGAIMGGLSALLVHWFPLQFIIQLLTLMAGVFMILLGLYLTQWWQILTSIERLGRIIWSQIEPYAQKLMPVQNSSQAFIAGMLWGWLPCGLVYAVLASAVASASVLKGALIMFAFGLGTLPALLLMGTFIGAIAHLAQNHRIRLVSGMIMITFGFITLFRCII